MRSRNSKIARTIASVLMSLLFLTAVSPAATKPISAPEGLARDSKENLYVANYSGNEILIYSPSYQQMKSITKSISGPTGIAFDPSGNFYVTNINANTITEYSPTGAYLSDIADVPTPDAISIDGVGNMCVQLADSAIILFSPSLNSEMQIANASGLQVNYFLGVATHGSQWAIGTDQGF
jgi:DNA-binding beta-propeller fold protein YncE